MPIKNLTDRGLAFPQIGVIRKGSPKGENRPGQDLQYFRVEFDEAEVKARQSFDDTYSKSGGKPAAMRVVFPFNEIDRVWDAYLEAYSASRLIARSDGETILYWRDNGNTIVKNGLATVTQTVKIWRRTEGKNTEPLEVELVEGQPVPYIEDMVFHRTEKTLVTAKPVGRLRVVLPELKRLAYLTLTTTSMNDIIALGGPESGELGAIKEICRILNLPLAGVPLILRRKPRPISFTKDDGSQSRMTRWLVHIEADPEFVEKALASSRHLAMPVVQLLASGEDDAVISGVDEPEFDDELSAEVDGDVVTVDEVREPTAQEASASERLEQNVGRPYTPEQLKERIQLFANKNQRENKINATQPQRGLVAGVLEKCFAGDPDSDRIRHSVMKYLTGYDSVAAKDGMPGIYVNALLDWLNPIKDSGGAYEPDSLAVKEANAVWTQALRDAGQMEMAV